MQRLTFGVSMLPRVLEPELMDTPEEARDYDAMDHYAVNRCFVEDLLHLWNDRGLILDLGTGTAQIPILLCQLEPRARVVAVDAARHMLELAHANIRRAGLEERIQLQRCDAKHLPFADGSFVMVMSNSLIHHIPEPRQVLKEMVRVVAPSGVLFVRDLLRPQDEAEVQRLVATYAGEANAHQQQMFAASLRAALTLPEIATLVQALGFSAASVQQTSDRHWTWATRV